MKPNIGPGIGIGVYGRPASSLFDLSTVAWTGWWDGDHYTVATGAAVGQASAGASGSRDLSAPATKPTAGSTYNGHASFNTGVIGKYLTTGLALSSFIAANASTAFIVAKISAIGADGAGYQRGSALTESSSYWAIGGGSTANVDFYQTPASGGETNLKLSDASGGGDGWLAGSLQVFSFWHDGATFNARVDAGAWKSTASANVHATGLAGTLRIGSNYNLGAAFVADIAEIAITNSVLDEEQRDAIAVSLMAKYGL
jgi:hypothetical protein